MKKPEQIAAAYIASWNETDPVDRSALLAETFAPDASYVDPLMSAASIEEIDGLIAAVQQRFPGHRFALKGTADGYSDKVRFTWELGPEAAEALIEGTDFLTIADGKIKSVVGFLDKVPSA